MEGNTKSINLAVLLHVVKNMDHIDRWEKNEFLVGIKEFHQKYIISLLYHITYDYVTEMNQKKGLNNVDALGILLPMIRKLAQGNKLQPDYFLGHEYAHESNFSFLEDMSRENQDRDAQIKIIQEYAKRKIKKEKKYDEIVLTLIIATQKFIPKLVESYSCYIFDYQKRIEELNKKGMNGDATILFEYCKIFNIYNMYGK